MERWVCKRCFASNDGDRAACTTCGLERGIVPPPGDAQLPPGARPLPRRAWWAPLLRFWWIAVIVVVAIGGYVTAAHRDSTGAITSSGTVKIGDLKVGDCFDAAKDTQISEVTARPCTQAHEYELYFTVEDTQAPSYPDDDAFTAFAASECLPAFQSWVGVAYDDSTLDVAFWQPTRDGWDHGDRTVVCALHDEANTELTSALKGAHR